MSVTLVTSPLNLGFSRNLNRVQLSGDYLVTAGSKATAQVSFSGIVTSVAWRIQWPGRDITFHFVVIPTIGTELPDGDGSVSHVAAIVTKLNQNYYINRDFNVTQLAGYPIINFVAKSSGRLYTLSMSLTSSIPYSSSPGIDLQKKSNFGYLIEVWRSKITGDSCLYRAILQLDAPLTGTATKDLSEIIHPYLDYDVPNLTDVWQDCPKSIMPYYLKYAESFGDKPEVQSVTVSNTYYAILGGYSNLALNVITDSEHLGNYLKGSASNLTAQNWLESWPIDNLVLKTNSPAFLYFVNNRPVTETLKIVIVMTYDNGNTATISRSGGTVNSFGKVAINCAYNVLGLNTYANVYRKVVSYTVQLFEVTSNTSRSVIKTFRIDHNYEPYTRYILYSDSCGNFKVLRLFGKSQLSSEVSDNYSQSFPDQRTPADGNINRYDIESIETDAINTGFIKRADLDNLKELCLAKKAYRVLDGAVVPINIVSKKFDYSADGVNLNSFKLEYQLRFQEEVYTGSSAALAVPQLNRPQPAPAELPSIPLPTNGGQLNISPIPFILS